MLSISATFCYSIIFTSLILSFHCLQTHIIVNIWLPIINHVDQIRIYRIRIITFCIYCGVFALHARADTHTNAHIQYHMTNYMSVKWLSVTHFICTTVASLLQCDCYFRLHFGYFTHAFRHLSFHIPLQKCIQN